MLHNRALIFFSQPAQLGIADKNPDYVPFVLTDAHVDMTLDDYKAVLQVKSS
jgi:hypothetical protein